VCVGVCRCVSVCVGVCRCVYARVDSPTPTHAYAICPAKPPPPQSITCRGVLSPLSCHASQPHHGHTAHKAHTDTKTNKSLTVWWL